MSELNVNTITEYTTNNGVTIDGVLLKDSKIGGTITIPGSTGTMALTSDISGGITNVDMWRLTADVTSSGVISANLTQNAFTNVGLVGTGMSESSGIFTFPSTGIWEVSFQGTIRISASTSYGAIEIQTTSNASTYTNAGSVINYGQEQYDTLGVHCKTILDITDTTNQKVRFYYWEGGTSYIDVDGTDRPNFFFVRLGDT